LPHAMHPFRISDALHNYHGRLSCSASGPVMFLIEFSFLPLANAHHSVETVEKVDTVWNASFGRLSSEPTATALRVTIVHGRCFKSVPLHDPRDAMSTGHPRFRCFARVFPAKRLDLKRP
jgi:hypothetical protein